MLRLFLGGQEKPNGSQSENILHLQFRHLIQKTMIYYIKALAHYKDFHKDFSEKIVVKIVVHI